MKAYLESELRAVLEALGVPADFTPEFETPGNPEQRTPSNRLNGNPGNAGSLNDPSGPTGGGGGGRSGGGNYPRLLNANSQGVAPQHDTGNPSATASGPARSSSAASSSVNTGSQGVVGSDQKRVHGNLGGGKGVETQFALRHK